MDTTADRPRLVECLQHTQRLLSRAGNRCTYSFLGKAKRRAQLLAINTHVQPGETVKSTEGDIGQVASVAEGLALAVLPIDTEYGELRVAGTLATPLPFVAGLAR